MRIAIIARAHTGYAIELANLLVQTQQVLLIIPGNQNQEINELVDPRVQIRVGPGFQPQNFVKFSYLWFLQQMRQFKPQVIHVQGTALELIFVRLFLKKCAVVTTRLETNGINEPWKFLRAKFDAMVSLLSHRIIVHVPEFRHDSGKNSVVSEKIRVIPYAQFNCFTRWKSEAIAEEPNWILFFGRITPGKGLEKLIRAAPEISRRVPTAKIFIAGWGAAISPYLAMIENPASFVILNYHVPEKMVAWLFQKAAVIVLPYRECIQSGVVRLAFSFAKPVVTTPLGYLPESSGVCIPQAGAVGLAAAVTGLLCDPKKRRCLGQNGFRSLCGERGWQRLARLTIQVYREALAEAFPKQEIWNASI